MAGRPRTNLPTFHGMSLDTWRSSESLTAWAVKDQTFQLVLEVMHEQLHQRSLSTCTNGDVQAGRMLGWGEALSTIQMLRQRQDKPPEAVPQDYGAGQAAAENSSSD